MRKILGVVLSVVLLVSLPTTYFANEEKYPKDHEGKYLVPENFKDPITLVSDQDFFGQYSNGQWINPGIFNYAFSKDLAYVEEAVKKGDYQQAKVNLLEYYRNVELTRTRPTINNVQTQRRILADMLEYNFMRSSNSSFRFVDAFTVNSQMKEIQLDLTESIEELLRSPRQIPVIQIMAVGKDGKRAKIASRSVSGMEPSIHMTVDGTPVVITAKEDSTVRAGEKRAEVYDEDYLFAQESMTTIKTVTKNDKAVEDWDVVDAVDANTERMVIKFDLGEISSSSKIDSPVLKLWGQTIEGGEKQLIAIGINDNLWTEDNICWDSYEHAMISYDQEPYIRQGGYFFNGFSRTYRDILQRMTGWVDYAVEMYQYSQDVEEKERYARIALTQLCGYLDQLGNADPLGYKNFDFESKTYDNANYGRNNLDLGNRMNKLINPFNQLIFSRHMTPEIYVSFMKLVYRSVDWLAKEENWSSHNNWGADQTTGIAFAIANFPEWQRRDELKQIVKDRSYNPKMAGEDMACIEVPLSYTRVALNMIYKLKRLTNEIGVPDGFSPEVVAQISDISKYLFYASMPGGLDSQQGNGSGYNRVVTNEAASVGNDYQIPEILWFNTNGQQGVAPAFDSHYYASNSKYIMRTGWGDKDLWLQTNVDGGYGNHGHADDLSIILHAYGKYLIADPSFDGLDYAKPSTAWLNSTTAHNTITINDKSQSVELKNGQFGEWATNKAFDFFKGTTIWNPDGTHARNILFVRDGFWIVSDYVVPHDQTQQNQVKQLWHFLPTANVSIDPDTNQARTNFDDINISVVPALGKDVESSIEQGYFGGGNNVLTNANYVEFKQSATGNVTYNTLLVPELSKKAVTHQELVLSDITEEGGAATKFSISSQDETIEANYYVLHDYSQAKMRSFGDYKSNGTMAYIQTENGALTKIYGRDATKSSQGIEIRDNQDLVLLKTGSMENIAVEHLGEVVKIYSHNNVNPKENTSVPAEIDLSTLTVYVPREISQVYVNDTPVSFSIKDNYIHFAQDNGDILKLMELDVIGDQQSLRLDGNVTRAEFIAMLVRILGLEIADYQEGFLDVRGNEWFANYLQTAKIHGLVQGFEGYACPNDNLTREQMAKLLVTAYQSKQGNIEAELVSFQDVGDISDWALEYVSKAVWVGIMNGYRNTLFQPASHISREYAFSVLGKMVEEIIN